MPRSVKVGKEFIDQVKTAVQRQGYPRQKDLAEELGLSLATVSNFLNGKAVDCLNFQEICTKLELDWKAIIFINHNGNCKNSITATNHQQPQEVNFEQFPDELEAENFMYVERPPIESICYQTLCQPGSLLRIKASGLMGKTSLMAKILPQLKRQGYHTVLLNLHYADTTDFTNLDKFLKWFCFSVGKYLNLTNRLADYWDEEFSTSKMNCTAYFEEYLLPKVASPLILCLDEVERIFPYGETASDFLGLLRAWHEAAKTRDIWKKLRLVVAHSTEVYVALKVNESPFNVGIPIELPEFTLEQVNNLAQRYGLTWGENEVKLLMDMMGGHPYLIGKAVFYIKNNPSINLLEMLKIADTEEGIYSNLLRHYWNIIKQDAELVEALIKVVKATDKVQLDSIQSYKLHSMGLVYLEGNRVRIASNLYRHYFCDQLRFS